MKKYIYIGQKAVVIIMLCFAFIVSLTGCEKKADNQDATDENKINMEEAKKEMDEFINSYSGFQIYAEGSDYVLFDITGDGYEELCTTILVGSGMVHSDLVVYDPYTHIGYRLSDFKYSFEIECVDDDSLVVKKIESYPKSSDSKLEEIRGTLAFENDEIVFVSTEM
ncbi:MAG: hypothetical protein ACI4L2_08850 [Wujia sp.]